MPQYQPANREGYKMGYYVNPPTETKESFLDRVGTKLDGPGTWADVPEDHLLVALVDNGWMTAAGVAYSESEFRAFTDPSDPRPITYYHVKTEDLLPVFDDGLESALAV